ncbi:MAG: DUF3990 domain-containing protein [Mogibacterium sp.]|nr:DUF3990 domain-containing protein [Mogibacterium sp.]
MSRMIDLYHGSTAIIRQPEHGFGRKYNDYGLGFYCTESEAMAKEWACSSLEDGFANHYRLDLEDLRILNLNCEDYTILNWIAVLVSHRLFRVRTPIAGRARRYLEEHFYVNVNAYDVVIGYRADDAYYDFADAFLNNAITVEQLSRAMRLGKLGEQVVLKSRPAFDRLQFADFSIAESNIYYPKRKARNYDAELDYLTIQKEDADGLFMIDIIRGEVKNDDARIPRNIPEQSNGSSGRCL